MYYALAICRHIVAIGIACLACTQSDAQTPIGLNEVDLMVYRTATTYDAYKDLPPLSDKARRVLLFEPGVVLVIAGPSDMWQYRSLSRTLIVSPVDKMDYDALDKILVSPLFVQLYSIMSQHPRVSGNAATMSVPAFYQKMSLQLTAIETLTLSPADKARLRQTVGEAIVDHPAKIDPDQLRDIPPDVLAPINSVRLAAKEREIKFLLNPDDVPKAGDAEAAQLWAALKAQIDAGATDARVFHIEPSPGAPNVFKYDLENGQRFLVTVNKEAAMTQKRNLKPKEFLDFLKSKKVTAWHLDTLGGDIASIPNGQLGIQK